MQVCLGANALSYQSGGHIWAYLNWALALRSAGCDVLWLESAREIDPEDLPALLDALRRTLRAFGFEDDALILDSDGPLPNDTPGRPVEDAAASAELLVDLGYNATEVARAFRRSAMIDIDPGFTQLWWSAGQLDLSGYDLHLTIGSAIAAGTARIPDCGVSWHHINPCVDLDAWPRCPPPGPGARWTTVTHWWGEWTEYDGGFDTSKNVGFEPVIELPGRVGSAQLELAIGSLDSAEERARLEGLGWHVREIAEDEDLDSHRRYVQGSRGEFSAAKPLYVRAGAGWLSDRTVCYLASGRPAIVQDTGLAADEQPGEGLLTFTGIDDATAALTEVEADYARHAAAARALAEDRFSGRVVARRLLELALA